MEIPEKHTLFDDSILVVAHPDDEVLWFSSILRRMEKIIVCYIHSDMFPGLKDGRIKSLSEYPLDNIKNLYLNETNAFDDRNWVQPEISPYGLKICCNRFAKKVYIENFRKLEGILRPLLTGFKNVFTHNPWGEYGHEEHVQLFWVLKKISRALGFNIWFPDWFSNKSAYLMNRSLHLLGGRYINFESNIKLCKKVKAIYMKNNCWTWYDDWEWMPQDTFFQLQDDSNLKPIYGHSFPMKMVNVEPIECGTKRNFNILEFVQRKFFVDTFKTKNSA